MRELSWKDVATRLKALRKQNKLTIEKLAEMVNVSTSFIGLVEKGESGVSLENLYKLAQVYNCSLDYLVTGKEADASEMSAPFSQLATACYGFSDDEIAFVAGFARFIRGKITVK